MHLVGMITLSILLSLGPGHPIPGPGYHTTQESGDLCGISISIDH
jgi:hypothetical protein